MRRVLFLVLTSIAACGGGSTEPVTPKPQASVKPPEPPPPPRARWVFSGPEKEVRAKLDLGDERTLYVGEHGRRELDAGGQLQHASTLAEEGLGGVMRDDKGRFVFVATDGDTYVATEPLGPMDRVAPARTDPLSSVSTGRASIVAVSKTGLVRSTDFGKTWRAVEYAGKSFGQAAQVALDGKGNGVLIHFPQRVFVTHDDGATWTKIPSPTRGAAQVLHDGADRVFVLGYHDALAVLDGDKLAGTKDVPTPIFPGQEIYQPRSWMTAEEFAGKRGRPRARMFQPSEHAPLRLLVGSRVVELSWKNGKVEVRSGALGEALGAPIAQPDLGEGALDERRLSVYGDEIAYVRVASEDEIMDAKVGSNPFAITIMRSKDFGATWKKEDSFSGVLRLDRRGIAIGPRGWTWIPQTCTSSFGDDCKPAKIRPAGKQAFEDVKGEISPSEFVFDEPHDKVWALADGSLYEGALGQSALTLVPSTKNRWAITVDGTGNVRTFENDDGVLTIHERSAKGEDRAPRYVALGGALAFAGRRGVAIGNHTSWETNDAGDTWTRVPSNGATHEFTCSAAGCLLDDAQRIGWDLPALQSTEVVRSSSQPPSDRTTPLKPVPVIATQQKITCKASGKATSDENGVSWADGIGAARWARLSWNSTDSGLSFVWADASAIHRAPALSAETQVGGVRTRTGTVERDDEMIAARYRFTQRGESEKLNPVRVELAWWSPSKPQVHRGVLPAVKPFRVSRGFSGQAHVVEGGLAFQGTPDDVVHFIHDDGTIEQLTPPGVQMSEAWRSGKKWIVLGWDDNVMAIATSEDGGKSWAMHGWAFEHISWTGEKMLEVMGGKPILRAPGGLYELAFPVGDPPAPIAIDDATKDARCDALVVGNATTREHMQGDSPVIMDLGGAKYTVNDRIMHDSSTGKMCTSVYEMEDGDHEAFVVPDKSGAWSGWSFRTDKSDKYVAEPISCK